MTSSSSPAPTAPEMRGDLELSTLTEIGHILSSTLDLRNGFQRMMQLISDKLAMRRGTLVLLDESSGRLRTEAAVGLSPDEIERGKYALGEGITGMVVATGRARVIPDLRVEPDFLNRTGRISPAEADVPVAYLCIPIKVDGRVVGALSVDRPAAND